jgi:hypothetical protein
MRQIDEVGKLPQGAESKVQEVQVFLEAFAGATFHDVGCDGNGGPAHLRRESEQLAPRKIAGDTIYLHRQPIRQLEGLQFPMVSHGEGVYA